MNKLITYEQYRKNGGMILPIVNSYDQENEIVSAEDKFNKYLEIVQINLNYVLQDKLEGVEYNLLNIAEDYRRDIINILVIRLNRAFENDRIIARNETTQYSEMGAITWSSIPDVQDEFWNAQELNMIEVSGLREEVNICCEEANQSSQYPATLTADLSNRLISDGTIDIKSKVNVTNGLTAIELKANEKMAKKSDIPKIDNLATKEEVNKKIDIKIAEQNYAKKVQIDKLTKEKINKQTINDLSEKTISESNRHQLLISKFNLVYTDLNQLKEWTFPNKNLYEKVKQFKASFQEPVNWNDSDLKVSYIWTENHDFEMKCFAILEDKFFDNVDFSAFVSDKQLNYEVVQNNFEYESLSYVLKQWIYDKDVRWVGEINSGNNPNSNSGIVIECLKSWNRNDGEKGANMIINIFSAWTSISYGNDFYNKLEIPFNALLDSGRFFGGSILSWSKSYTVPLKIWNISDDYWRNLLYKSKVFITRKERFK